MGSPVGQFTLALFEGEGVGGNKVAESSDLMNDSGQELSWVTWGIDNPPLVEVGQVYTIRLSVPDSMDGWIVMIEEDAYKAGKTNHAAGHPGWDHIFKTYVKVLSQ